MIYSVKIILNHVSICYCRFQIVELLHNLKGPVRYLYATIFPSILVTRLQQQTQASISKKYIRII
jgi:hypothetical protein